MYQGTCQRRHCEVWLGKFRGPPRNHSKCEETTSSRKKGMKALEVYYYNLAAVTVNKKSVLEQLLVNNTKLAATNESLVVMVKKVTGDIKNLERDNTRLKKGGQSSQGPTLCHHCKREEYHAPDACDNLAENKDKIPPGWRSLL